MNILELANSIGWPVAFIAFERGIVIRPKGNSWVTHSSGKAPPVQISINDLSRQWLPVMIRCASEQRGSPLDIMLHPSGGFTPIVPEVATPVNLMYDFLALQYLSNAIVHHVVGLVLAYEQVRDTYKDITLIPGIMREPRGFFQDNPEPYFEFDALLGVVRRGYDACRYILWKCFGPGKGTMPRSFERVLPVCNRLDPVTRTALEESWRVWGTKVTTYRDCIHHYVPLDFGMASIDMQETLPGVWSAWARIPDNPEARSKAGFTFAKNLDALTFGWIIAVELSRVFRIVLTAIEQEQAG